MTDEPESNRPERDPELYCPDCGIELQYRPYAGGCGAAGNITCIHTEAECLRRQLAAERSVKP